MPTRPAMLPLLLVALLACLALPATAVVVTREQGLDFVTVGAPGNRGANAQEAPAWAVFAPPLGAVDHEYRIMRTNITYQQYLPFLQAYAPHHQGVPFSGSLMGLGINYLGTGPSGQPLYELVPGQENCTATMGWRIAARFANWTHNGQVNEAWAFENGAYDTSTFGASAQGIPTDQFTHNPDAKFWIPSIHEMAKATYYDPDRYGPGQEGYWLHPDGGMEQLVAGPPGIGEAAGHTIGLLENIAVGSYPETQSPWGLWDVSSTYPQATEGWLHPTQGPQRIKVGSRVGEEFYWVYDQLQIHVSQDRIGLRLATAVPATSSGAWFVAMLALGVKGRRRI